MDMPKLSKAGGIVTAIYSVLGGIRWLVKVGSDVDFVVTRADDPGWIKTVLIALFVDPPWWVVLSALVAACGFFWWSSRQRDTKPKDDDSDRADRVSPGPVERNKLEDEVFRLRQKLQRRERPLSPGAAEAFAQPFVKPLRNTLAERDTEIRALKEQVAELEDDGPKIDQLKLDDEEPSVRTLPFEGRPVCSYGLRRIYVVNLGRDTILQDWEVRLTLPSGDVVSHAEIMSAGSWGPFADVLQPPSAVPVMCKADAVKMPSNEPTRLDIPFIAPGLSGEDLTQVGTIVEIIFKDGTGREWSYGKEGRMKRRV